MKVYGLVWPIWLKEFLYAVPGKRSRGHGSLRLVRGGDFKRRGSGRAGIAYRSVRGVPRPRRGAEGRVGGARFMGAGGDLGRFRPAALRENLRRGRTKVVAFPVAAGGFVLLPDGRPGSGGLPGAGCGVLLPELRTGAGGAAGPGGIGAAERGRRPGGEDSGRSGHAEANEPPGAGRERIAVLSVRGRVGAAAGKGGRCGFR